MGLLAPKPNPEVLAPIGAYMIDDDAGRMVEILEADHSGAIGECLRTGDLFNITPGELAGEHKHWRLLRMADRRAA